MTNKIKLLIGVAAIVLAVSGCDRKRQERVAQTEKLDQIEYQLAEIKTDLITIAQRPAATYQPAPTYAPTTSLTLNPDSDAIVQITDFSPAPAPSATKISSRRAEVARLGQTTPSAKTTKKTPKKSSSSNKSSAKTNYGKNIVVSGLSARDVQTALKNAGYNPGSIDGKVGPKTVAAIKSFQRVEGLSADGVVGRRTWEKLSAHLSGSTVSAVSGGGAAADSDYIPASEFTF